jgi:PAS domain S-box-containing protein
MPNGIPSEAGASGAAPLSEQQTRAALLGDIVANADVVIYRFRLGDDSQLEYISDAIATLVGYTPAECYADPQLMQKLIHADDAEAMARLLETSNGSVGELQLRWVHRDGHVVWTEQRFVVTRTADGAPLVVDGVVRDVSSREQARQERLRLLEQAEPVRRTTESARVVLADDHDLTRAGLRTVLGEDSRLRVVGEARDGREAVTLVQQLHPELVLMDLRMPGMDGLQATRTLKQTCPLTSVLILSMFEDAELLLEAVRAGAAGYVLKSATEEEVRTAIWDALDGNFPVDHRLARQVLQNLSKEQASKRPPPTDGRLSAREQEVLAKLALGQTNREIAEALVITPNTVKIHVEHILAKLGVSDRTQAAVRAIELGYITRGPA